MLVRSRGKLILIAILVTTTIVGGCGVNNNLTVEKIKDNISEVVDFDGMEKGDAKSLKRYYQLNINDYDGAVIYVPKSNMDVNEMLIIKVKDEEQISSLEDSIDSRINYQLQSFEGYGPEQCDLVNNYELKVRGNYVFFAISKNAEQLKDAFLKSIEK